MSFPADEVTGELKLI